MKRINFPLWKNCSDKETERRKKGSNTWRNVDWVSGEMNIFFYISYPVFSRCEEQIVYFVIEIIYCL